METGTREGKEARVWAQLRISLKRISLATFHLECIMTGTVEVEAAVYSVRGENMR